MSAKEAEIFELLRVLNEAKVEQSHGTMLIMTINLAADGSDNAAFVEAGFTVVRNETMAQRYNNGVWYGHWDVSW